MPKGAKPSTHTTLVLDELIHTDQEFLTIHELIGLTGSSYNQVSAALHLPSSVPSH